MSDCGAGSYCGVTRRVVLDFRRPSHERFKKNCGRGERHPGNARVTPCRSLGHAAGQEEATTQESVDNVADWDGSSRTIGFLEIACY